MIIKTKFDIGDTVYWVDSFGKTRNGVIASINYYSEFETVSYIVNVKNIYGRVKPREFDEELVFATPKQAEEESDKL